jgi:hypothetical protein
MIANPIDCLRKRGKTLHRQQGVFNRKNNPDLIRYFLEYTRLMVIFLQIYSFYI